MNHFFIKSEQIDGDSVRIVGDDVNHIKNVLRMRPGEELTVSDESGTELLCRIAGYEPSSCTAGDEPRCRTAGGEVRRVELEIIERAQCSRELPVQIVLYQGLPKADKMETIIQKCVELGVSRIVPVAQARCVMKLDAKKESSRHERWQRIAESAAKQSKRGIVPEVSHVMSFGQAMEDMQTGVLGICADEICGDSVDPDNPDESRCMTTGMRKPVLSVIAYEEHTGSEGLREISNRLSLWKGLPRQEGDAVARRQINIFIGPEGGYEPEEVEAAVAAGAIPVSLGPRILRTETAGMALIAYIMLTTEAVASPVEARSAEERR